MSTTGEEILKSFDLLPEPEKHQIASEILRRAYAGNTPELDDVQLAALYTDFAETDRSLAEEGIADYERNLASEDTE